MNNNNFFQMLSMMNGMGGMNNNVNQQPMQNPFNNMFNMMNMFNNNPQNFQKPVENTKVSSGDGIGWGLAPLQGILDPNTIKILHGMLSQN